MCRLGIEQHRHHRQFGGGIGMRETAADGAAVADGEMRHMRHGVGKDRQVPGNQRRGLELKMPRQSTDADARRRVLDERQALNAIDIDEYRRLEQAKIEHRNKTLPAGNDFCIVAGTGKRRHRHVDAVGNNVIKRRRLHNSRMTRTRLYTE